MKLKQGKMGDSLPWELDHPSEVPGAWEGPQCLSLPGGDAAHPLGTSDLTQENSRELAREEIPSRDFSMCSARSSIPQLASSHLLENSAKTFLASVQKSLL